MPRRRVAAMGLLDGAAEDAEGEGSMDAAALPLHALVWRNDADALARETSASQVCMCVCMCVHMCV